MKTKSMVLFGLFLTLGMVISGCATGLTASSWPGITADANNAFLAGGPYVYAINLQTGVEAWRFPAKAATATPFFATPMLTNDGQLIVGSFDHKLYSLNPVSGAENWRFEQAKDRWIGGVLVTNDGIYATNADYNLYALDFTGKLKWVTPFQADQAIWGSPVSDGTKVYFGTLGRHVYAVSTQTGKQSWVQAVNGAILGSPVLGPNNSLYVGTYGGVLIALDTTDGTIIQQQPVSSWIWSGPAQDGTSIYVGDATGMLYTFPMTETGQRWTQQLDGAIIGSPLVNEKIIIVGTEKGNIYFLDKAGQNLQTIVITGAIEATPISAGSLILVAPTGGDNALVALDQSGAIKWKFTPTK